MDDIGTVHYGQCSGAGMPASLLPEATHARSTLEAYKAQFGEYQTVTVNKEPVVLFGEHLGEFARQQRRGGDGFAFVIQNSLNASRALGAVGSGMGETSCSCELRARWL